MRIETSGVKEATGQLDAMAALVSKATPDGIDKVMDQLVRQTKVMLSRGQHPPGTPTGSIAPNPPWRISGALRNSPTKTRARPVGTYRWQGEAGPSGVAYQRIQELGGWAGHGHRSHLPARPYLKPAWSIVKLTAGRTMARGWSSAVKSALR